MNKPAFLEVLKKLVHSQKWKRRKLFFCVPDDTVVIRQLKVPLTLTTVEIKGYIETQIGSSIYLPFSNPIIDVELLEVENDQQNILLFAYPKD